MTAENQENTIVKKMFSEIESLRDSNPDFFADFEDIDPDTATRSELVDLMEKSPTDQVRFFLFGKFTMRLMIASVTGRAFI